MSAAVAVGFGFIVGYCGLPFVMSLYPQQLRGLSPVATGLVFLPMAVAVVGALLAQPAFTQGPRTSLLLAAGVALAAAAASRLLQRPGGSHDPEIAPT